MRYIHYFSYSFLLWFITGYWIEIPELYSRTLLFIHPVYNCLHLLTPNSQPSPPLPASILAAILYVCESVSDSKRRSLSRVSLRPHGLYSPWNSPGQNTGVGSLSLLQRIFPTQELNQGLLRCRRVLYQLSYLSKIHPNNQSLYKYDSWFLLCAFRYCFMILMVQSLTSTPHPVLSQRKLLLLPVKHVNSRQK